jgi:DHA3 family macrolide efflux protein-like MFS transporter
VRHHLRTFYVLTVTQVLSLIGSGMTHVAVGIRVFSDTGDSTPLLLASFFGALPLMIGGSLAGVLADRWQRRRVLIASDAGQAVATLLLLLSFVSGRFELWHLYALSFLQGLLAMLQRPAMEASVTMLVPEAHRDRANAIRQITGPAAGMIAPVITGFAYAVVGVSGVMAIDLATFVAAVVVVYLVHIPQPQSTREGQAARGSIWREMRGGLAFLWGRRVLLYLMLYAALINFLLSGPISLNTPYIMTLTGEETTLGVLLGVLNVGIVMGGVAMGVWGGTRPRVHGIMLGLLFRATWLAVYGIARTPVTLGLALFFVFFTNALVDASFMSILQLKVPPDMQGRVFALLFQMMYIANPLSLLLTGPLVDRVLEPAVGGPGWEIAAPLVGSRPGSGMGLLMVIAGGLILVLTAAVYVLPKTRSVEADLPDYAAARGMSSVRRTGEAQA